MRLVIQRVSSASVAVDGQIVGEIEKGLLVFVGIGKGDTEVQVDQFVKKLSTLRIFEDAQGKTNLSLRDVGGSVLAVSQFTLYADCRHGNRPGFTEAGAPDEANRLYEYFVRRTEELCGSCAHGIFGADMKVSLVNDGPFTLIWDSSQW